MNELINNLRLDAGIAQLKDDPRLVVIDREGNVIDPLIGLEKFAELIVKECARIARATPCPYEENEVRQRLGHTWDMASLEAGHEIVKHFGVEK